MYVCEALSIHYVRFIYGVVVAALDDSTTVVSSTSTKEHQHQYWAGHPPPYNPRYKACSVRLWQNDTGNIILRNDY